MRASPTILRQDAIQVVVLLLVAVITRGLWIGDPLVGGDEQFYYLAAKIAASMPRDALDIFGRNDLH